MRSANIFVNALMRRSQDATHPYFPPRWNDGRINPRGNNANSLNGGGTSISHILDALLFFFPSVHPFRILFSPEDRYAHSPYYKAIFPLFLSRHSQFGGILNETFHGKLRCQPGALQIGNLFSDLRPFPIIPFLSAPSTKTSFVRS